MQGPLHWEAEEGDMYVSQGKGGKGGAGCNAQAAGGWAQNPSACFVWGLPIICLALLCVT